MQRSPYLLWFIEILQNTVTNRIFPWNITLLEYSDKSERNNDNYFSTSKKMNIYSAFSYNKCTFSQRWVLTKMTNTSLHAIRSCLWTFKIYNEVGFNTHEKLYILWGGGPIISTFPIFFETRSSAMQWHVTRISANFLPAHSRRIIKVQLDDKKIKFLCFIDCCRFNKTKFFMTARGGHVTLGTIVLPLSKNR